MNNEPAARTVKPAALPWNRTAFTLIELLVVIAIIAILAAGLENTTSFCVMTAWR